jgi:hypothetical protein
MLFSTKVRTKLRLKYLYYYAMSATVVQQPWPYNKKLRSHEQTDDDNYCFLCPHYKHVIVIMFLLFRKIIPMQT